METEQIVHDASVAWHSTGKVTSYLQLRGSVPTFWSQVSIVWLCVCVHVRVCVCMHVCVCSSLCAVKWVDDFFVGISKRQN